MKKLFVLLLALAIMLSLAACGGKDNDTPPSDGGRVQSSQQTQENKPAESKPADEKTDAKQDEQTEGASVGAAGWLTTKTGRFYSQFTDGMYLEYETTYEGMTMQVITASKDGKSYTESTMDGMSGGVSIIDGDTLYTIDHASKTVIQMSASFFGQEMADTLIEEADIDPAALITGTREVGGKTYDTEEWIIEDAKSILCFDGDDLAYMIGEVEGVEVVMKIIDFSSKVDESLFEIPSDYQVISY